MRVMREPSGSKKKGRRDAVYHADPDPPHAVVVCRRHEYEGRLETSSLFLCFCEI